MGTSVGAGLVGMKEVVGNPVVGDAVGERDIVGAAVVGAVVGTVLKVGAYGMLGGERDDGTEGGTGRETSHIGNHSLGSYSPMMTPCAHTSTIPMNNNKCRSPL